MKLQTPLNTDGKEFFEDKRLDVQKFPGNRSNVAVKYTRNSRRGDQKRDNTVGIICNQARREHSENVMYSDGINHRQGVIEVKNRIRLVRFSALPQRRYGILAIAFIYHI